MATIFLVEDELSTLALYNSLLKANGFEILDEAKNGEEAVIKYLSFSKKPDVIIMDYKMPLKNGLEATKEILQINNKAKIIIVSGDRAIEHITKEIGAISFIKKPFDNKRLVKNIEKAVKGVVNSYFKCI